VVVLAKGPVRRVRAGAAPRVGGARETRVRIVGGRFRHRTLAGPKSDAIRPTSDRLRETIFNVLAHAYDDPVAGARVIDLFAGTGAMGLEALSRGARFALFVDEGAQARGVIRENVEALGLGGSARLFRRDAARMGPIGPMEPFSLVFCDPPYARDLAPKALASCGAGGWLAPGALVVVEEAQGAAITLPEGFSEIERRDYGETAVVFGRYAS
jgi:16S rRNA (guanine966-N2)-methyltransferase